MVMWPNEWMSRRQVLVRIFHTKSKFGAWELPWLAPAQLETLRKEALPSPSEAESSLLGEDWMRGGKRATSPAGMTGGTVSK